MRFRNTKTGAIVDAPSMLRGNWERIDGGKSKTKETPAAFSEPLPEVEKESTPAKVKKTRTKRTKK